MEKFKPILSPNEVPNLQELDYPLIASFKLDGIRDVFLRGDILSRSLKPIVNRQLREEFQSIADYTRMKNLILDGEIYSPDLTFQEITRYVMTKDFEDVRSVKKFGEILTIPAHLNFYCFDCIVNGDFDKPYADRIKDYERIAKDLYNITDKFYMIEQFLVNSAKDVEALFEKALEAGYEGLILRDLEGRYKFGRGTLREGIIYKVKPYRTFDAKIIGIEQATIVNPNAEKKINELGRSVTSKKKGDRILIEKASAFVVEYETECIDCYGKGVWFGTEPSDENLCEICRGSGKIKNIVKPVLSMIDAEKEEVWRNRESYIGKWIQYKGMLVGAKDVPRHPVMERFRKDKDFARTKITVKIWRR